MTINSTAYTLSTLLDGKPYELAYSLPLLFLSLLLAFAGAFLTLDRTREFAPRDDSKLSRHPELERAAHYLRAVFLLEGGLGGLASGYALGVHLTTFLSLLVPSVTSSSEPSAKSFLAAWALSAISFSYLSGRWKYIALFSAGLAGFSTLAVAISVIVHPSLTGRIAFTAILTPIGTVLCLLPFEQYQHLILRIATSASGSFGTILAISILAGQSSWITAWERLWVSDATDWNSDTEKGLSAGFCLLFIAGNVSDWFLKRAFGENPDEKWDKYLADYTASLPHASSRAGTFAPMQSFWSRHFGHGSPTAAAFSEMSDSKNPILFSPTTKLHEWHANAEPPKLPAFLAPRDRAGQLRKKRKDPLADFRRQREAVKFSPLSVDDLSSSDEDDDEKGRRKAPVYDVNETEVLSKQPLSRIEATSLTLVDSSLEGSRAQSDFNPSHGSSEYSPRAGLGRAVEGANGPYDEEDVTASVSEQSTAVARSSAASPPLSLSFSPIPATLSLIRAIDRISAAQQAAYGPPLSSTAASPSAVPITNGPHNPRWQTFWQEVRFKAGHGATQRQ